MTFVSNFLLLAESVLPKRASELKLVERGPERPASAVRAVPGHHKTVNRNGDENRRAVCGGRKRKRGRVRGKGKI